MRLPTTLPTTLPAALALCLALSPLPCFAAGTDDGPVARQQLIDHVLDQWAHDGTGFGDSWPQHLEAWLYSTDLPSLRAAAQARSAESVAAILEHGARLEGQPAFGSSGGNQVYFPLPPCRLLDTRQPSNNTGRIPAGTTRFVYTQASIANFSTLQGGANSNCGLIPAQQAEALSLNITVVQPASAGYLTAWRAGQAQPTASALNFVAASNLSNEVVVPVNPFADQGLAVYLHREAHLVIDVLGYYARPESAPLDCYNTVTSSLLQGNNFTTLAGTSCDPGFIATGGGCDVANSTVNTLSNRIDTGSSQRWQCRFLNPSVDPVPASVYTRCCQTPGR